MQRLTEHEITDLFMEIEERAAIIEFDGRPSSDCDDEYSGDSHRLWAERMARREVIEKWSTFLPVPEYEALVAEFDVRARVRDLREKQKAAIAGRRR